MVVYLVAIFSRPPCCTAGFVIKTGTHRHADAALGNLQVQRLVQALAAVFDERIQARHPQSAPPYCTYTGTSEARTSTTRTSGWLVGKISLRDFSGSSATVIPAAASSGRVSS